MTETGPPTFSFLFLDMYVKDALFTTFEHPSDENLFQTINDNVISKCARKRYFLKPGYFLHQLPKPEAPVRNQLSYKNK